MLNYTRADREFADRHLDFFLPELAKSHIFDECIFYIGYEEDTMELISAAAVYPTTGGAKLLSVSVSAGRERNGIGSALLDFVTEDLRDIYARFSPAFPVLEVTECLRTEVWESLGSFLEKNSFNLRECAQLKGIMLSDILKVAPLPAKDRIKNAVDIVPLKKLPGKSIRAFGNRMVEQLLYPKLDIESLDPELSTFYVQNGEIKGCFLISRISDRELMNEWLFLDSEVKDRTVIMSMLALSADTAGRTLHHDTVVYFLAINDRGSKLLKKLLPGFPVDSEIRTYEKLLEKK